MIRGVLGSRASIGGVLGSGRGGAAAAAWYLAGGVSAVNAIAVYQPKGAASLAASYVNLANPGTYNAAPGTAPTFDTATGWTFAAASTQYLATAYTPTIHDVSVIVRISNAVAGQGGHVFGVNNGTGKRLLIQPSNTVPTTAFFNGGTVSNGGGVLSGTLAIAGNQAYINGSAVATIAAGTAGSLGLQFFVGCSNAGSANAPWTGKIQALAIYNTTLTAPQVAAISSAMSLL